MENSRKYLATASAMMFGWRRRRRWPVGALFVAAMVWLVVGTVPALAAYTVRGEVGVHGGGDGAFWTFGPDGVAVDGSTGDLYAVDGGNARVQKFTAALSPAFLLTYGWGVSHGTGFEICSNSCTFGREGNGAGQFGAEFNVANTQAMGIAVDPVSHDAYVADTFNNRVEYFEAGGAFVGQFDGERAVAGKFLRPRGIAVDGSGDVYVEDTGHGVIDKFSATGAFMCQITGHAATASEECDASGSATPDGGLSLEGAEGAGLAVDSSGDLFLADTGHNVVDEFSAAGAFVRQLGAGLLSAPQSVAVSATGNVFAGGGSTVYVFSPAGALLSEFGAGTVGEGFGLASRPAGGVYVTDRANQKVLVYGAFPGVVTGEASNVTATSAILNGTVNPEGAAITTCEFEYGPVGGATTKVPCAQSQAQIGTGEAPVAVTAEVSGLRADVEYRARLVAGSLEEQAVGEETSFRAIESVFGFQLAGPNALEMLVSNSANPSEPAAANPTDLDSQAGSHPFDVTTRFLINTESNGNLPLDLQPKDYYVNVPAGFAGSVAKIPRCRMSELSSLFNSQRPPGCATASQVGVIRLFKGAGAGAPESEVLPVYNMVPSPGAPAELAFPYIQIGEPVVFQVRSDGDYGVTAKVRNISEAMPIVGSQLTLWGVPADPRHDLERFLPLRGSSGNIEFIPGNAKGGPLPAGTAEVPFLTNPTKCGQQSEAVVTGDSWLRPGKLAEDGLPVPGGAGWVSASTPMFQEGIVGCGKLTFHPELEVKPDTTVADLPTGLTVDLRVPQSEGANNLATPALKDAVLTLSQGLSISSAQGDRREGCTPEEIALGTMREPSCPNASQVGKLELTTPLLPEPLTGQIYLSSERSGSTFHVYLVIEGQGVLIKLGGSVEANEQTGQLVSRFDENPQLPFSDLKLTFYGGSAAALATPDACGSYATSSVLEPWSHEPAEGEAQGTPNAEPAVEPFSISSGCVSGFSPAFKAGVTNPVAGAFSPFVLSFSREDDEEELSGLQTTLPPGLVGKLAGVATCSDAQIAAAEHNTGAAEKAHPSCPAGSLLGTVESGAGPGSSPFFLPGKAYLTGAYRGAPYGIVVIVPALAGPFDLGTVIVRSRIDIDPRTAQVSVTSDPLPTMLDGIPLKIRRVDVTIDRPSFTLNPTSCEAMKITGTLRSAGGSQHPVSALFKVGDCASLAFKPGFKVSTKARHTKRFGDSLHVKITSGPGQANIKSVLVKLPKALPSRVETLKGACSEKQFAENPAGCPAVSKVGSAIARTPILATPLTGPAIFVSHGGAAFPDLDIVLQGSGVTVILEGNTNIHHNITTSDFKSAPDVPVSSFELTLPTGPHSALAANGNLCLKTVRRGRHRVRRRVKLVMPTTITGQNGAVVHQSTHVVVQGCAGGARGRRG